MAGTTTTRSAGWPSRVCGMGEASSHSEVLHRLGGQRGERHRADEARGLLGQDGRDVDAGVDQPPADLDRLVGGDAAADAEDDAWCAGGPVSARRAVLGLGPSAPLAAPVVSSA